MTPQQLLRQDALLAASKRGESALPEITADNVDALYDEYVKRCLHALGNPTEPVVSGFPMTPQQKLRWAVLLSLYGYDKRAVPEVTADNIDELYDALADHAMFGDAVERLRCSGRETGLSMDWIVDDVMDREFNRKTVAAQMTDGSWVGWTYYYPGGSVGPALGMENFERAGRGGRASDPGRWPWMEDAYEVQMAEELVLKRTYTRCGHSASFVNNKGIWHCLEAGLGYTSNVLEDCSPPQYT